MYCFTCQRPIGDSKASKRSKESSGAREVFFSSSIWILWKKKCLKNGISFFQMNCPLKKILKAAVNILSPKSCCLSRGDVAYTGDTLRWLKLNNRPKIANPKPCCSWRVTRPPASSCCKNLLGQEFHNYQEEREGIETLLTK